jgi:hypothetical protein
VELVVDIELTHFSRSNSIYYRQKIASVRMVRVVCKRARQAHHYCLDLGFLHVEFNFCYPCLHIFVFLIFQGCMRREERANNDRAKVPCLPRSDVVIRGAPPRVWKRRADCILSKLRAGV